MYANHIPNPNTQPINIQPINIQPIRPTSLAQDDLHQPIIGRVPPIDDSRNHRFLKHHTTTLGADTMPKASPELTSCGFIIFRQPANPEFLVMEHRDRLDLPKGHVDPGETLMQCALRELEEETGLTPAQIDIDPHFEFITRYTVNNRRTQNQDRLKELRLYLAWLNDSQATITLTEHRGCHWQTWQPEMQLQKKTFDPLLRAIDQHWPSGNPTPPNNS